MKINQRNFELPQDLADLLKESIDGLLNKPWNAPTVAKYVKNLSDQYTQKKSLEDIWSRKEHHIAYLTYFAPLNLVRLMAVVKEGEAQGFFNDLEQNIDFGSGTGAFDFILKNQFPFQFKNSHFIERSKEAANLHKRLQKSWMGKTWGNWSEGPPDQKTISSSKTLGSFSYSLNEITSLPSWALQCEALLLAEPSTQKDGRNLLEIRNQLKEEGFYLWAPCTHQWDCPLLKESKKDWCHDRVFAKLPDWFTEVEKHLPMKNRSLTFSYLLARKQPADSQASHLGRVIGDTQKEKGKTKQMICRGDKREFLSWLKKRGEAAIIPRGSLIKINDGWETKSNEIRPNGPIEIIRI